MWRRNTVETMRSAAGSEGFRRDRAARRSRVGVEMLEGRRMMDGSTSGTLLLAAQVDAQAAASGCSAVVANYNQAVNQVTVQAQQSLAILATSAGQVQTFINQETALLKQAGQVAGSAAVAIESNLLAGAKAELQGLQQAENTVLQAYLGTMAYLRQQESAGVQVCIQAAAQSQAEAQADVSGATQTAAALHAAIGAEMSAVSQLVGTTRDVAGSVIKTLGQYGASLAAQANQELSGFGQAMASLKLDVAGSVGATGQAGLSSGSTVGH